MAGIEDLVRDSLRHRAQDVEPTPALWREVDRRIARRRRSVVLSWSMAGAAAAIAALVVVPGLLAEGFGPDLEIEPFGPHITGTVPGVAVVADDTDLSLLEFATGQRTPLELGSDGPIEQIAVRPGSTPDDYGIAVVQTDPTGEAGAILSFLYGLDGSDVSGTLESHALEPDFVPTVQWSPDGEHVAYTVPGFEGQGNLFIEPAPHVSDGFLEPREASGIVPITEDAQLVDWVGPTTGSGATSTLFARDGGGILLGVPVVVGEVPGVFVARDDPRPVERLTGAAGAAIDGPTAVAHVGAAGADRPIYALAPGADGGAALHWIAAGDADAASTVVEVPLTEVVGDRALGDLWLDARQDAALIGDGARAWVVAHDGDGAFAEPVEVVDVTLGALLDAPSPAAGDDMPTEGVPIGDVPADDEGVDPVAGSDLPLVTVSADALTLIGSDGPQTLLTLGEEGESRFVSARVRPGSTLDDLTIAAVTTAEGLWDLWDVRVVDGEVTRDPFGGSAAPGRSGPGGEEVSVLGPVWSPDGAHLAWFEWGTGQATLRTVGWADGPGTGDAATDNADFALDGVDADPLVPVEWVTTPDGPAATEIRAIAAGASEGWFAIPVDIQADGALAMVGGATADDWRREWSIGGAGTVEGMAATFRPDGLVAWLAMTNSLQVTEQDEGAQLIRDPAQAAERFTLPEDLWPDDGLPNYYMRSVGDGVVLGSRDTGVAYLATPDGGFSRLDAPAVDADVVD